MFNYFLSNLTTECRTDYGSELCQVGDRKMYAIIHSVEVLKLLTAEIKLCEVSRQDNLTHPSGARREYRAHSHRLIYEIHNALGDVRALGNV